MKEQHLSHEVLRLAMRLSIIAIADIRAVMVACVTTSTGLAIVVNGRHLLDLPETIVRLGVDEARSRIVDLLMATHYPYGV